SIYESQITSNQADSLGGGIYIDSSNVNLFGGSIDANSAVSGGGISLINSTLTINESVFDGNYAILSGGGLYGIESNLFIDQSAFYNNTAENGYGGVVNLSNLDSLATYYSSVTNSVFEYNMAYNCAGLDFWTSQTDMSGLAINISNCQFRTNSANRNTAILITGQNTYFTITDCEFSNNEADDYAAGINMYGKPTGTIAKSLFQNNHVNNTGVENDGGAISIYSDANVDVVNCTVVNNSAGIGGGLTCGGNSITRLINTIMWNNHPNQINLSPWNEFTGEIGIEYCVVQDGVDSISTDPEFIINWGAGNIDLDPYFIDPGSHNYSLSSESPCIDAGHPDLDSDGITWENDPDEQDPDGTRMDMGAYYYHQDSTGTQTTANVTPGPYSRLAQVDTIWMDFSNPVSQSKVVTYCQLTSVNFGDFGYLVGQTSNLQCYFVPTETYPFNDLVILITSPDMVDEQNNPVDITAITNVEFQTNLPADFTGDNVIDYQDFSTFTDLWYSDDEMLINRFDLFPYNGGLPDIMVFPDGQFG
ncbi:MAG: hypothetical protein KAT07_13445, partial [Calditrichia bacterium]|nr:hypothetical protein [Calditrichia bacterium]